VQGQLPRAEVDHVIDLDVVSTHPRLGVDECGARHRQVDERETSQGDLPNLGDERRVCPRSARSALDESTWDKGMAPLTQLT